MTDDTRTLYAAALAAGLQPVGAFILSAYGYILIAAPDATWSHPDIPGWRFIGAAPVTSYTALGDGVPMPVEKGVALWYINSSMAYPDGAVSK